ncbi:MAG: hypothetical protein AB1589_44860 [Cyanobacteriota bacterium]
MLTEKISLNNPNIDQLKNFQRWKQANGDDFSLWDYLFRASRAEVAIVFTKLFWPDFVEHEGGIFLSEAFDSKIYEQWKAQLGNDMPSIERVMNHQHIDDILQGADKVGAENLLYLGQAIAQMWESRLKLLYPYQRFQVVCNQDEYTVVVTFYQV